MQSTVRKKMATGTFTYNALRTTTLKECIKTQRKIVSHSNSTRALNAVSVGTTAIEPYLSICLVGLVWFARHCGKMYNRYLIFLAVDYRRYLHYYSLYNLLHKTIQLMKNANEYMKDHIFELGRKM